MLKSDERWEIVEIVAAYGLPSAFGIGAFAGLICWRSRKLWLSPLQFAACCFVIALVSMMLRPHIAIVRISGWDPLYEVVPDLMSKLFALLAAAGLVWAFVSYAMKSQSSQTHCPD